MDFEVRLSKYVSSSDFEKRKIVACAEFSESSRTNVNTKCLFSIALLSLLEIRILLFSIVKCTRTDSILLNCTTAKLVYRYIWVILVFCYSSIAFGQQIDADAIRKAENEDPLRPARAAFYSAVLPGLGQVYNKRYWKIPLVYGAIGASVFTYDQNHKNYLRYRNAYKRRLAGYTDDEFQGLIPSTDRLIDGQDFYKRNRDRSMLFILGFYLLNILDANIDAHLKQYNVNSDLSFKPYLDIAPVDAQPVAGMRVALTF